MTNQVETKTAPVVGTMISLHEYMAFCLDSVQAETRASLVVGSNPPSGRGSDHATIRPLAL
jgi:hypothetical protein